MFSSYGPISIRGMRTQAVRKKASVLSHTHDCSSLLSSVQTVAFHICALGQFVHIPGHSFSSLLQPSVFSLFS